MIEYLNENYYSLNYISSYVCSDCGYVSRTGGI